MPRQSDLYLRWVREMRQAGWFRAGERVGAAVSGGPDSCLLLVFLAQYARQAGFNLAVVHFNHQLRGRESDDDERFVGERARELGKEFITGRADTARLARAGHRSLEETARELRYRFFFRLIAEGKLDKVATAHTANDQAETVLLRLLRGSGTRGLGGIHPLLDGKIVRPFLSLTRGEINAELVSRNLAFRVDATNQDLKFVRNRIRASLLPWLEREFNPNLVSLLKQLADQARDEEAFLEEAASDRARPWRVAEGGVEKIPVRRLLEFPPAIGRRVLRQMIASARGHLRGITHAHIDSLKSFAAQAQSGRRLELPGGFEARREFDWLAIGPVGAITRGTSFCYEVRVPGRVRVPELGLEFRLEVSENLEANETRTAYNISEELALDPDTLPGTLVLRNWRPGDRFWPSGRSRPLKVQDLFRESKIPLPARQGWPVLQSGKQIVWVRGFPPGRWLAAPRPTRRRLLIFETPLWKCRDCQ